MRNTVLKIGFWSGLLAFTFTIAYVVVQLLQVWGILSFPLDEIFIYGTSLCIVIPFLFEMLALHYVTADDKKFWSHAALVFSILYAVFVISNYVVQLAMVVPMKIKSRLGEVAILEQTPHSLFWNFDALGYIFMGLSGLVAIPIFEKHGIEKWVRAALIGNSAVTPLIAIVYFYPTYSERLLILGYPWAITAPAFMLMIAISFRKGLNLRGQPALLPGLSIY